MGNIYSWLFSSVDYDKVEFLHRGGPVRIVVCCLEKLKNVDVLVNSTDKSLRLGCGGNISNTILQHAGPGIQAEIDEKYPNGIKSGEIAVTGAHNLPYKFVLHGSLQHINKEISHHEMREVVTDFLQTAAEMRRRPSSIAFPVIGTGAMGFHRRLFKTIYRTLLEFIHKNPGPLKAAYIIIYPGNAQVKEYASYINPNEEHERITYPASFPSSWSNTDDICRIELKPSDDKYSYIAKKFKKSLNKDVDIIKIERIQNKRLYVTSRWYRNKFPNVSTKQLWHGTKHESVNGIIRHGFDWRLCKRSRLGKGCYFTDKAAYADQDMFSEPNAEGEKYIFLVDVTIGKTIQGNGNLTELNLPPTAQTAIGVDGNINFYITFDDDQIYPLFLIVYKRK